MKGTQEPTVIGERLHFTAAGADLSTPGQQVWCFRIPLQDGRELWIHLGDTLRQSLRVEPIASPLSRPALRYHGGKWKMGGWIVDHLPPHGTYVEPFGGSAAVLLRKQPSAFEVWNDLSHQVKTFFTVLRERTAELIRAIELTPYHRAEALQAERAPETTDPLETARRFYVRSWQTYGGIRDTRTSSGFRFDVAPTDKANVDLWTNTEQLWAVAARLRGVQFESRDALDVISRYGQQRTALLYCDPPYVTSTRNRRWDSAAYAVEFSDEDHRRLAELLHAVEAQVVVSGYPSPLYDELFEGWRRVDRQVRTQGRGEATECLWIAPPPEEGASCGAIAPATAGSWRCRSRREQQRDRPDAPHARRGTSRVPTPQRRHSPPAQVRRT